MESSQSRPHLDHTNATGRNKEPEDPLSPAVNETGVPCVQMGFSAEINKSVCRPFNQARAQLEGHLFTHSHTEKKVLKTLWFYLGIAMQGSCTSHHHSTHH